MTKCHSLSRSIIACFTAAALSTSASAQRYDLPTAGRCYNLEDATIVIRDLEWDGDAAVIRQDGRMYTGKTFVRASNYGFKASIFYENVLFDQIEIVIHSTNYQGKTTHQIGWVGYRILPDGSRFADGIVPLQDADCTTN